MDLTFAAIGLFDISAILFVWVFLLSFAYHKFDWWQKSVSITYLIGTVLLLQKKTTIELIFDANPAFFFVMFIAVNLYCLSILVPHYQTTKYVQRRMRERLGGAKLLSWKTLVEQRIKTTEHYSVAAATKLFIENRKIVFESIVKKSDGVTEWYFNDFTKQFQIIDGVLQLEFKTGEQEEVNSSEESVIRPYEAHRIRAATDEVKILVTCIK